LKKGDDEQFKSVLLNRRSFPAVKIGILAVGKDFQKQGIGSSLLDALIYTFINQSNKTGCMFVTVDAVKDAIEFYSKNNFRFLSEDDLEKDTMQMYRCLL
jgi:predicted N-acetyltransferase YhbS